MNDDLSETRIIFRPTPEQYKRLLKVFDGSGRYRHLSELIRHCINIGLDEIESVISRVEEKR
jgi:hypothetical protein